MIRYVCVHGFTGGPASFEPLFSVARDAARESRATGTLAASALDSAVPPSPGAQAATEQVLRPEETLCFTLHGHGPDPDTSARSFEQETERLLRTIDAKCTHPPVLVGYSMGARLCLALCCRALQQVASALLIGANPGLPGARERAARARWEDEWVAVLEREGMDEFEQRWSAQPLFASQKRLSSATLRAQRALRRSHTPEGLVSALRVLGLSGMPNLWPQLPALQVPLCVVCGTDDRKFVAIAQRMADCTPRATLRLLSGAGHNPLLDAPQHVLAALLVHAHAHPDAPGQNGWAALPGDAPEGPGGTGSGAP